MGGSAKPGLAAPVQLARYMPVRLAGGAGRSFGAVGLRSLWSRLVEERLVEVVFHDGGVRSLDDFCSLLAPERAWLYRMDAEGVPVGFFWCNGFGGRSAQVHFCFFRSGMPLARDAGRTALRFLLVAADGRREAPLMTLVGGTPAPYRHALRLAYDLGFSRLGVVPQGARLAPGVPGGGPHGKVVDLVLTVATRDMLT